MVLNNDLFRNDRPSFRENLKVKRYYVIKIIRVVKTEFNLAGHINEDPKKMYANIESNARIKFQNSHVRPLPDKQRRIYNEEASEVNFAHWGGEWKVASAKLDRVHD